MADGGLLGEIVARKRVDVFERLKGVSLGELSVRAAPTRRSLKQALAKPGARFIFELKRASPSQGFLRPDVDAEALARGYDGVADAMSVLLDTPFFGGSLADLDSVRAAFDGPILAKDFFVDPRQVTEARLHGADAILIMLSVLGDEEARAIIAEAERLQMDVLVEVHDEQEVRRAIALGAELIGINNRDLKSLAVNLQTTERLSALVPSSAILVAESGIDDRADIERLAPFADAFLIGSSLMQAEDPGKAGRTLAFGRVKICGLTAPDDLKLALRSGAQFAGLVMVPASPRAVDLDEAEALIRDVPKDLAIVGVFQNAKVMEVAFAARALSFDAVQLHGEEPSTYLLGLRSLLPEEIEIWAASAVDRRVPDRRLGADRTVFDTKIGNRSGGTGKTFDWSLVEGRPELATGILAGGLNVRNVKAASRLRPYALDVGSSVESKAVRKDPVKLAALFNALRPATRKEQSKC
ncbi:MAG TPA: bifunctional indole-3-glycerol-phosphate synthase TrpC/phosphoribosylanthranilate isomerase TrpF [Sphingomicrobium sp.]|nr:bifunctional indole-3-glycerol-phosphate synthase TrpC/phosphoribosylanthranilate isomerase TrpF [Sphingomicrobium sp.]